MILAHPPHGRAGAQGEIEVNDFDRRQTDTVVEDEQTNGRICRSPSAALGELGRITPAFPVGRVRR
jgi:hypothetical protein